MALRKYASGSVTDVSGTDETVEDLNQAADNDVELTAPDENDYEQSN